MTKPTQFSIEQLEQTAATMLREMPMKNGGVQPSTEAVEILARTMARKAMREQKARATSQASASQPLPPASS